MRAIITDYGALGDGQSVNTKAIQAAIKACEANGGGTVVVPAGMFVTGTIELKSHVTLHLEQGAVLRGSSNMDDYPPKSFEGFRETPTLIYATGQIDVRITGEGLIDLNADPFMDFNQLKIAPGKEIGAEFDEKQRMEAVVEHLYRPDQPILFDHCRRLKIDGVTIYNAPAWALSISSCQDVKITGITIDNNLRVPNNDGIHLASCKDVIITDCVLYCGDDCVAITGIRNWKGISERIIVSNCTMVSRSAAVRVGHLKSKVHDILITNLIIKDSNRGIGIFAGDEGYIENVIVSNVIMETRLIAGAWWGHGEPLVISAVEGTTGWIKGVTVSNVRAQAENGVIIVGDRKNISDVELRDWHLAVGYGPNRSLFKPVYDLAPAPMPPAPNPDERIPWMYANDVADLRLKNIRYGRSFEEQRKFSVDALISDVEGFEVDGAVEFNRG